jgi:hypothetical protein
MIQDTPQREGGPGEWASYYPLNDYPPVGRYVFPKELYMQVSGKTKISFDLLGWSKRVCIVSERMLEFFVEQGLSNEFDVGNLTLINRSGKTIETDRKYMALRFISCDDHLLIFGEPKKVTGSIYGEEHIVYPEMVIKEHVTKKIFKSEDIELFRTLIFTEEIKNLIKKAGFITPNIYAMSELDKISLW